MAMGGWKTPAMFRRYAIVSTADQRAAVEKLERAREERPLFRPSLKQETTPPPAPAREVNVQ